MQASLRVSNANESPTAALWLPKKMPSRGKLQGRAGSDRPPEEAVRRSGSRPDKTGTHAALDVLLYVHLEVTTVALGF